MVEDGIVVEEKDGIAVVKMRQREDAVCRGCGLCRKRDGREDTLDADNSRGARPGDAVRVEVPEGDLLSACFFLFGMPVVGFLVGAFLAHGISLKPLRVVAFLVPLLGSWWVGLALAERLGRRRRPKILP